MKTFQSDVHGVGRRNDNSILKEQLIVAQQRVQYLESLHVNGGASSAAEPPLVCQAPLRECVLPECDTSSSTRFVHTTVGKRSSSPSSSAPQKKNKAILPNDDRLRMIEMQPTSSHTTPHQHHQTDSHTNTPAPVPVPEPEPAPVPTPEQAPTTVTPTHRHLPNNTTPTVYDDRLRMLEMQLRATQVSLQRREAEADLQRMEIMLLREEVGNAYQQLSHAGGPQKAGHHHKAEHHHKSNHHHKAEHHHSP